MGFRKNYSTSKASRPYSAGQATHETRPHIVNSGELTMGIQALEYYERRIKFLKQLPSKSCAILVSNDIKYATGPVFYPFRQDTDLLYLTGWMEPDSVAILEKPTDNVDDSVLHLLVPDKNPQAEQWDGPRSGVEGALEIFNADKSSPIEHLHNYLPELLRRNDNIYVHQEIANAIHPRKQSLPIKKSRAHVTRSEPLTNEVVNILRDQQGTGHSKKNLIGELGVKIAQLRKIKSPQEIELIHAAGIISGRAFNLAMARKFKYEKNLASYLEHKFIDGGCDHSAYIPVVAAGSNALCIHYTINNDSIADNELVLVDAAGAAGGYCADISRTWPANGVFSNAQKDLYQAILNVQRKCLEMCTVDNGVSLDDIHRASVRYMIEELRNVNVSLANDVGKLYPHYIGHNLGLDVHDIPEISRYDRLQHNQVITIEPGVYIPNNVTYPEYYRNIGIRIEDDVVIGKGTYTNLTSNAIKEIADIENVIHNGISTKYPADISRPL